MSPYIHPDDTVTITGEDGHWTVDAITPATTHRPARVSVSTCRRDGRVLRTTATEVAPERVHYVRRGNADQDAANQALAAAGLDPIPRGAGQHHVLAGGEIVAATTPNPHQGA